jgi:hypothetical protein
MSQSGFTPIQIYYSTTSGNVPSAANLINGELAINLVDGRLFYDYAGVKVIGWSAPVTKTADFTVAPNEDNIIVNAAATCTVTLPDPASFSGRSIKFLTYAAFAVNSASTNVVPLTGGAAGASILTATAGKWATIVSDESNWVILQSN